MTLEPFDLEWMGGVAEKHFRRVRPGVEQLPWGTLDPTRYPTALVDSARVAWTEAAYNEYCTAAGFAEMLGALLAAKAPIDLIGMASDFMADELLHVELTSRIAMELGGGAPFELDFSDLRIEPAVDLSPLQRASQLVMQICCVSEAFSLPMLASAYGAAIHPLTKQVLQRIVHDEAPHGRFGFLYLDWIAADFDDAERTRLAEIAAETLETLAPKWQTLTSRVIDGVTSEGYRIEHVHELGWSEASAWKSRALSAVENEILAPLARYGIVVPRERVEPLLG